MSDDDKQRPRPQKWTGFIFDYELRLHFDITSQFGSKNFMEFAEIIAKSSPTVIQLWSNQTKEIILCLCRQVNRRKTCRVHAAFFLPFVHIILLILLLEPCTDGISTRKESAPKWSQQSTHTKHKQSIALYSTFNTLEWCFCVSFLFEVD